MQKTKMKIGVRCPYCTLIFTVGDYEIGKTVRCPYCGTESIACEDGEVRIMEGTPTSCGRDP